MSKQLDKVKLVKGRQWERQDPLDTIGVSTNTLIKEAIQEGKNKLAKDLIDYFYWWETKIVKDTNIDLSNGLGSFFMASYGEHDLYEDLMTVMKRGFGLTSWPPKQAKKRDVPGLGAALEHAGEMVRTNRMGKNDGIGGFTIEEYEDRYEVLWDPCYSGGMARRGDPTLCTPPRTGTPYNYAVNKEPHTWTGGRTGMMGWCLHCPVLHELMEIEHTGGYLSQWIVGYKDPWAPCSYICYKEVDWVPEEYYTRLGRTKPKVTSPIPKFKDTTKPINVKHSDELGPAYISTVRKVKEAIDAGNKKEALQLADQLHAEMAIRLPTPPLMLAWAWMDIIVDKYGYSELYHALRSVYSPMEPPLAPDEPRPTKAQLPTALERARKAALWGRGDRSGPDGSSVTIIDEPDRIVMELKPCGSGGRSLMTIDKMDEVSETLAKEFKAPGLTRGPLTGPPWNLGVTTEAHPVAWGKVGIPHLCTRCCVHFEMAAIARHGYLTTVIDRPANGTDPNCRWYFYKDLDDVPEEYYTRIGARKPARQP